MSKFKHQYNYTEFPRIRSRGGGISKTVPDQAMSVRELMNRFARGMPLSNGREPVYLGEDDDTPDVAAMELTDQMDYLKQQREKVKELKRKQIYDEQDRQERERKEFYRKQFIDEQKSKEVSNESESESE